MKRLLQAAGNNMSAIARTCGITPQAVQKWKTAGEVPLHRVAELCKAYDLRPHDIRPDVFKEDDNGKGARRVSRHR